MQTPNNLDVHHQALLDDMNAPEDEALERHLRRDPALRYLEETSLLYRVVTALERVITVPKDRAVIPAYPPPKPTPLHGVVRWLRYSAITLPFAGLLTLIAAPVAAVLAWRALRQPLDTIQRKRAEMALVYAGAMWLVACLLSFLFLMHL